MKINPYKKKFLFLLCILQLSTFLLSGCWNYTEIDKTVIVAGIAIDKFANGKMYKVTAETVDVGTGKDKPVAPKIIESDGFTIMDCIRNMIRISSKKLSFSHCKVIIISEQVAREGISSVLDIILRDQELRLNNNIVIAKNISAKDIFNLKSIITPIKSYELDTTMDINNKFLSKGPTGELYKLLYSLQMEGISPMLPTVSPLKNNNDVTFALSGTAVFKQDKLIGFLNTEESKYLRFIRNKIEGGVLMTKMPEGNQYFFGAEIFENKTKIKPDYINNEFILNIQTKTEVGLNEIGSSKNLFESKKLADYQHSLEQTLEKNIMRLIKKVQTEFDSDIFGFGNNLYLQKCPYWNENKANWDEVFKTLKADVKSEVIIKNSGLAKKTINLVD